MKCEINDSERRTCSKQLFGVRSLPARLLLHMWAVPLLSTAAPPSSAAPEAVHPTLDGWRPLPSAATCDRRPAALPATLGATPPTTSAVEAVDDDNDEPSSSDRNVHREKLFADASTRLNSRCMRPRLLAADASASSESGLTYPAQQP